MFLVFNSYYILQESMKTFHLLLKETSRRLQALSKRLGSCVEKSRPYYDAVGVAANARSECQRAAVQFQRASGKFNITFYWVKYERIAGLLHAHWVQSLYHNVLRGLVTTKVLPYILQGRIIFIYSTPNKKLFAKS